MGGSQSSPFVLRRSSFFTVKIEAAAFFLPHCMALDARQPRPYSLLSQPQTTLITAELIQTGL
jgi:hypothetical protein